MINIDEDLNEILIQAGLSVENRSKVIKLAKELEEAKKEEKGDEKVSKGKNTFTILIRGDKEIADKVAAGWIVKHPLEQDAGETAERLIRAAIS